MENIPQSLQAALKARKVIPFVGAGVSMAVLNKSGVRAYPSWSDFLIRCSKKLEEENRIPEADVVRGLTKSQDPDFLRAAEHARKTLGPKWFECISESFDLDFSDINPASLDLARSIWDIGALVITTNFDNVLLWSHPRRESLKQWRIESPAAMGQFLVRGNNSTSALWNLHGHIDDAAKLILTPDGFTAIYSSIEEERLYTAALVTLRQALTGYTFLFIGFSMDDDFCIRQIYWIQSVFSGATSLHYALIHDKEVSKVRALKAPVEIISFPDFKTLPALVTKLALYAAPNNTISSTQMPPQSSFPFNVPYRQKGQRVINKSEVLQSLRQTLSEVPRTALGQAASFQGLGGLGKTQMAVEYSYDYRKEYSGGIWWIHASQNIISQIVIYADKYKFLSEGIKDEDKSKAAIASFKAMQSALIVFDNVERINDILPFLPDDGTRTHVIVTSIHEMPGFKNIPITLLDTASSLTLLEYESERTFGPVEKQWALKVVEILSGLPLALEIAGAYLYHRDVSIEVYHQILSANLSMALPPELHSGSFTKHNASVFHTVQLSREQARSNKTLDESLRVLCHCGLGPISSSLLSSLVDCTLPELLDAIGLGSKLRLASLNENNEITTHRIIREVLRTEAVSTEWIDQLLNKTCLWFDAIRSDPGNISKVAFDGVHLNSLLELARVQKSIHECRLTWLSAYIPFYSGQFQQSIELQDAAFKILDTSTVDGRELEAHLLHDKASVLSFLGNFEEAKALSERALAARKALQGTSHPEYPLTLNNLGVCYTRLGKHTEALEVQMEANRLRKLQLPNNKSQYALTLVNVCGTLRILGQFTKAHNVAKEAVTFCEENLESTHPWAAAASLHLANVYADLGDFKNSLIHAEKGLEIRRKVFSSSHPDKASALLQVASAKCNCDQNDEALELINEALETRRNCGLWTHPDTSNALDVKGGILADLGDKKAAFNCFQDSLDLRRSLLGELHSETALSFDNLGIWLSNNGEYEDAKTSFERSLEIRMQTLGPDHPSTALAQWYLSRAVLKLGDTDYAARLVEQSLKTRLTVFGPMHRFSIECGVGAIQMKHRANKKGAFLELKNLLASLPANHECRAFITEQIKNIGPIRGFRS